MLKSFKIRNFKSILDEIISLDYAEKKAPNGYKALPILPFLENVKGDRLIPLLMIFGANASGKTNLVEGIQVFKKVLHNGIDGNYFPNKLNPKYSSTRFEIHFSTEKDIYLYTLDYNAKCILEESLSQGETTLFSIKTTIDTQAEGGKERYETKTDFKNIVQEGYGIPELLRVFEVECFYDDERQVKSFLWKIVDKYPGLNSSLREAKEHLSNKITGTMSNNLHPSTIKWLTTGKEDAYEKKLFKKISDAITRLDIDITHFKVETVQTKNSRFRIEDGRIIQTKPTEDKIFTYHKDVWGEEVPFDFLKEESAGTKRLFGLLAMLFVALEEGRTVFVDELDSSLHPFLVSYLIDLFKNKETNTTNAQLIITTHNPYALEQNSIRISEVAFTNKTLRSGTQLKYLYQFEDIRNTTDFVKQYLEGRLTGIPLIY